MADPLRIGEHVLKINTGIGIAVFDGAMTADQLIKAVDSAMYETKHGERNCFRLLGAGSGEGQ
jgi:GGDEF domain-containing protein